MKWEKRTEHLVAAALQTANPKIPFHREIFGWAAVSAVGILLIGCGFTASLSDECWMARSFYGGGVAIFTTKFLTWEETRAYSGKKRVWMTIAALFSGVLVIVGGEAVNRIRKNHILTAKSSSAPQPANTSSQFTPQAPRNYRYPSVKDMFDENQPNQIKLAPAHPSKYTNPKTGSFSRVFGVVLVDARLQIFVYSFYIPKSSDTFTMCKDLANRLIQPYESLDELLKSSDYGDFFERPVPETMMTIRHPVFSRKVLIYHETELPLYQRAEIDRLFRVRGMAVDFRGQDYALTQSPIPGDTPLGNR